MKNKMTPQEFIYKMQSILNYKRGSKDWKEVFVNKIKELIKKV